MSGDALTLILDGDPRLVGVVKLQRSRDKWYAATPWAQAVTGAHPIAVINQAFLPKWDTSADAGILEIFTEMRRFETIVIERRADTLVRITIRNAVRGCSAWPNMNGEELSPGHLDAQYHALRLSVYPLGPELERTIAFAARWVSAQDHLNPYELQLLRGWARRWLRQQRRIAGEPGPESWASAVDALVEKLGSFLRIESSLARALAVPPPRVVVDPGQVTLKIADGDELPIGSLDRFREEELSNWGHVDRKIQGDLDPRPAFFPCGCSRAKVDLGRCDVYKPGESP